MSCAAIRAPNCIQRIQHRWRHYREQLLGALAWWTGTLGQPRDKQDMQPPEVSLAFIARMAAAVDDLDALDAR